MESADSRSSSQRGRLAVLGAAMLFSTGGTAIKASALTGLQVAAGRSALAAIVLFALLPGWRAFWRAGPLLVGLGYAATMVGFVVANKLTTAANAIFLQSTAPVYVLFLAPLVLGERSRRADVAATGVMLLGLAAFFVGSEPASPSATDPERGDWIAACTGVAWACTIVGLRWLARRPRSASRDDVGAAVVAGNLIGAMLCAPFVDPIGDGAGPGDLLLVLYLGVFQIGLAYVLMTYGMRSVEALEVSLLVLVEPVLAAFWAWLLLGEVLGAWAAGGCALILGATIARARST